MLKNYLHNKEGLKTFRKNEKIWRFIAPNFHCACLICADRGHSYLQTQSAYQDARYYFLLLRP